MDRKHGWAAIASWFRGRKGNKVEHARSPVERRRFTRVGVGVPGRVFVISTGADADCVVTNISPAGAEIACEIESLLDTPVVLYAAGLGRFDGHVVWERDGSYGVKFGRNESKGPRGKTPATDSNREKAQASDRRRDKRVASNVHAQFMREDGSVVPCVVLDFSIGGVSLRTSVRPPLGENVLIGGMVGKVVRFHETGFGVEFVARERDDASFRKSLQSLDSWRIDDGHAEEPDRNDGGGS